MVKSMQVFGAVLAIVATLAFARPAWAQDMTADTVVATVNGTNITLGPYDRAARHPARTISSAARRCACSKAFWIN